MAAWVSLGNRLVCSFNRFCILLMLVEMVPVVSSFYQGLAENIVKESTVGGGRDACPLYSLTHKDMKMKRMVFQATILHCKAVLDLG